MEKEFLPYNEALALKELGFDEPCLYVFYTKQKPIQYSKKMGIKNSEIDSVYVTAPLYQQAFKWFMNKYNLDHSIEDDVVYDDNDNEIIMWDFFIYKIGQEKSDNKKMEFCSNNYNTFIELFSKEDAELECIKKLIEIIKKQ